MKELSYPSKTSSLPEIRIEYFKQVDLIVNITKHELVPKHILLTEEEKKEVLKKL